MTAFSADDLKELLLVARNLADCALGAAQRGHWWAVDFSITEAVENLTAARALLFHPADLQDDQPVPLVGHIDLPPPPCPPPVDNPPPIGG